MENNSLLLLNHRGYSLAFMADHRIGNVILLNGDYSEGEESSPASSASVTRSTSPIPEASHEDATKLKAEYFPEIRKAPVYEFN